MKKIFMLVALVLGGFSVAQAQETNVTSKVTAKKAQQIEANKEVKTNSVQAVQEKNLNATKSDVQLNTQKATKEAAISFKEVGVESLPKTILADITNKYDGAKISSVKTDGQGNYELQIEDASQDSGMLNISVMDSAHKQ